MQYLSKAYSYYSGINPATLSGAIDVIVVRHVDSDGQVTLASSPFHVRFGKLQVLRAAEKRVTIKMPNNLPSPHTVPFSMKVGETGEAFFVLETTDDVPEELLTSPVVMPTDTDDAPAQPQPARPNTPRRETAGLVTKEPFGETEKIVRHGTHADVLGEVDFLDLNAPGKKPAGNTSLEGTASLPSSILDSADSLIPPTPHNEADSKPSNTALESASSARTLPVSNAPRTPPNPVEAGPGESSELPIRDHKLTDVARIAQDHDIASQNSPDDAATDALPKVLPGQADGPAVHYGSDVVLDMAGYHNRTSEADFKHGAEHSKRSPVRSSVIDSFTRDLIAAIGLLSAAPSRPTLSQHVQTDPAIQISSTSEAFQAENDAASSFELALSDQDDDSEERHFDRGQSEPPPDLTRTPRGFSRPLHGTAMGPPAGISSREVMDYAWDWGTLPNLTSHPDDVDEYTVSMERSNSGPVSVASIDNGSSPSSTSIAQAESGKSASRLGHVDQNPYIFTLTGPSGAVHAFEMAICGSTAFARDGKATPEEENAFIKSRLTYSKFLEDPDVLDDPRLVLRYSLSYLSWDNAGELLRALSRYRQTVGFEASPKNAERPVSGSSWSWWRKKGQTVEAPEVMLPSSAPVTQSSPTPSQPTPIEPSPPQFAKTLRLSSDQLKQLNLQPGPNTVEFSVTSSYSGLATCTARIFLWQDTDQIVISDIDGTITKSDALGHVFAAIGRDWTHLGIARLYTDVCNNGYKMMYLTSRAIGQADSTREYLKSITQGDYRLPEGPVIMSPDRLMASLHREVIMRKPELFKMACLRDIQRLFTSRANEAFFAGFGNRITDAMSYRSVGVPTSKIYTIDSTGVVKTELLQAAGHKGSYVALNDLVNEVFPPVKTAFKPEYTDFNYWRSDIADIPLPDLSPPSPALSARSDSSRYSVLGKIIGRRSSKQPLLPTSEPSSRPSSPLIEPSMTPDELSELEDEGRASMPGSFEQRGQYMPTEDTYGHAERGDQGGDEIDDEDCPEGDDSFDDDAIFDDDILATGEMKNVPF